VIDQATELELIDLPPDELLQRLKEGKVYVPEQAARAIQKFFVRANLTALRELTMRRAAERVDDQMRAYMQTRAIPGRGRPKITCSCASAPVHCPSDWCARRAAWPTSWMPSGAPSM